MEIRASVPVSIRVFYTCSLCPIWQLSSLDIFGTNQANMQAKSYTAALLHGRCPHCREGAIFTYPVSRVAQFNRMNERCPHCNVRLEPEPGFYQGAMYVGYGITVGCLLLISVILYVLVNPSSEWTYIITNIVFMICIAPLNYRYSRILYLYFFGGIKYDARA